MLPNLPEVTAKQIIRYIAWGYGNSERLGASFARSVAEDPDSDLSKHYRLVSNGHYRDAQVYREIIRDIKSGAVQTWLVGGKVNEP